MRYLLRGLLWPISSHQVIRLRFITKKIQRYRCELSCCSTLEEKHFVVVWYLPTGKLWVYILLIAQQMKEISKNYKRVRRSFSVFLRMEMKWGPRWDISITLIAEPCQFSVSVAALANTEVGRVAGPGLKLKVVSLLLDLSISDSYSVGQPAKNEWQKCHVALFSVLLPATTRYWTNTK